jgi:hypothetical protein
MSMMSIARWFSKAHLEHVAQKCGRFCDKNMLQNKSLEHVFDSIKNKRALVPANLRLLVAQISFAAVFCASLTSAGYADKIKNPTAVFSGLDKITGRIIAFEAGVDETIQFGSLQLTTRVCYSRPDYENPQTTTFIEVDEITSETQFKRIFSGWMFAASPGLNAIEHPVYDIWLTECKGGKDIIKTPPEPEDEPDAPGAMVDLKRNPRPVPPLAGTTRVPGTLGADQGPLRLPDDQQRPRAQPSQRYFPTTPPAPRGIIPGYDPAGRNN